MKGWLFVGALILLGFWWVSNGINSFLGLQVLPAGTFLLLFLFAIVALVLLVLVDLGASRSADGR